MFVLLSKFSSTVISHKKDCGTFRDRLDVHIYSLLLIPVILILLEMLFNMQNVFANISASSILIALIAIDGSKLYCFSKRASNYIRTTIYNLFK